MQPISPVSKPACSWQTICLLIVGLAISCSGCASLFEAKDENGDTAAALKELKKAPPLPSLVREAAVAQGLHTIQVDGVGLVSRLNRTGGAPDPSTQRDELIDEMQRHDIVDPNTYLESTDNALVRVRALIPPGARRGDSLDIRVLAPKSSQATDLAGGWLLDTRLQVQLRLKKRILQSSLRSGDVLVIGTGPVLTRAAYSSGTDATNRLEGSVISGGRVQEDREFSLVLRPEFQHVKIATEIAEAINQRFFFFDGSTRSGIAEAKRDNLISIVPHPRYRDNVFRMMEVIRAIRVSGGPGEVQRRLNRLSEELQSPSTAADAALQLEAIGDAAVPTLVSGLLADDPELRFYAAEALAYLENKDAVEALEASARDHSAFRAPALVALQGMKPFAAIEALLRLMDSQSLETRYGAFATLRRRPDGRSHLGGTSLGAFWLYQVPSDAPPAVVVSLRESSEVVLFGEVPPLVMKKYLRGPSGLLIKPVGDQLQIDRFVIGQDDQHTEVPATVDGLVVGLVNVGASYGNVIEVLRSLKHRGELECQFGVDTLPKSLRKYYRNAEQESDGEITGEDSDSPVGSELAE